MLIKIGEILLAAIGLYVLGILMVKSLFYFVDSVHLSNMKEALPEEDYREYETMYKEKGGIEGMTSEGLKL